MNSTNLILALVLAAAPLSPANRSAGPKAVKLTGQIKCEQADSYYNPAFYGFTLTVRTADETESTYYLVTQGMKHDQDLRLLDKQVIDVEGLVGYRDRQLFLFVIKIGNGHPTQTGDVMMKSLIDRINAWYYVRVGRKYFDDDRECIYLPYEDILKELPLLREDHATEHP